MPYRDAVHTVLETPTFLRDIAQSGMSEDQHERIARQVAENPTRGDVIPGTGGARKVRFAGRGKGKSGGYRVVTYFAADDVPVLLLALIDKGERADLSQAERNALRMELQGFAADYRAGVRAKIAVLRKGRRR
jgi:mRNA-degrading endonuclease RelE of RelBE toxin-antitoxin system